MVATHQIPQAPPLPKWTVPKLALNFFTGILFLKNVKYNICILLEELWHAHMLFVYSRNLTWRDMQHLVVRTSTTEHLHSDDFIMNAVGRKVSHKFGYGLLDALALVNLARKWKTVPPQHICRETPEAQQK